MRNNFRVGGRYNLGLTLLECALAVLIAGTTVIAVLEASTNTIQTATFSIDNRLGALLASELIAKECMGQFPNEAEADSTETEPGEEIEYYSGGLQDVDTAQFGEQYRGFSYEITKSYENIDIETELSDPDENADESSNTSSDSADTTTEEELPTIRIVKVKVVVYFPEQAGDEERRTLTVETFIRPPSYPSSDANANK